MLIKIKKAPVAQLDRAADYGSAGWGFDSLQACLNEEKWMREALKEAELALREGEVPVGAVVVVNERIVGKGHNQTERLKDPTAHAEIIAITAACNALGSSRLEKAEVYVTLEPCVMCTGAMVLARIKKLVFGAQEKKFGACGSKYNIPFDNLLNHTFEVKKGVLEKKAKELLEEFFKKRRRDGRVDEGARLEIA